MKKYFILLLIIIIILGVIVKQKTGKTKVEKVDNIRYVNTYIVERGEVKLTKEFFGKIIGKSQTEIYSTVPGRFIKYNVKEGEYVKKDQIIAEIDRAIPGVDFESVKIKAPISGIVFDLNYLKGQFVMQKNPIAMIADYSDLMVRVYASKDMLNQIKKNTEAEIYVNEEKYDGKVIRSSYSTNNFTQMGSIDIQLLSNNKQLINAPCRVYIIMDKMDNAIRVPFEAVKKIKSQYFIFKYTDKKAKKFFIEPVLIGDKYIAINEVIQLGDTIITTGMDVLNDNESVRIK